MNVSVIIPIYNVGQFIGRCAESLLGQTLQDVEFIFVDDATPDNSMDELSSVMAKHTDRLPQIKILRHEQNRGLPAARNTGLAAATGDYIFHCDSDDFMEPDMLEILYHEAKKSLADVVWCDWYLTFQKNERYMTQPSAATGDEALRLMLTGKMKYNVWNKLVKRELYTSNGITFPEGYGMGEDMTIIRLMTCAEKVAYTPKALYHYVKTNTQAYTSNFSERQLADVMHNTSETCTFVSQHHQGNIEEELACFKLSVKYPLLISGDKRNYDLWRTIFREADAYLNSRQTGLRCRLLQQAAAHHFDLILKLHYRLIFKVVYGVLYK